MEILANTLGCRIGSFPFTYLGLPMGTTKPRVEDFTPLMDRIERRLSACSSLILRKIGNGKNSVNLNGHLCNVYPEAPKGCD